MQDGRVDRADLQLDHAGVAELLGERNILPVEERPAHVDGNRPVGVFFGIEDAGDGLEGKAASAGFGRQRLHHTAHAVAAGLGR